MCLKLLTNFCWKSCSNHFKWIKERLTYTLMSMKQTKSDFTDVGWLRWWTISLFHWEMKVLLALNANWWGCRPVEMLSLMCWRSSFSKHCIRIGVTATRQQSFSLDTVDFFRYWDDGAWSRWEQPPVTVSVLKMSVMTSTSWLAHSYSLLSGGFLHPISSLFVTYNHTGYNHGEMYDC